MKTCKKCGETKPLDMFYNDRGKADGKESACKVCRKKGIDRWRAENKDRVRQANRARKFRNIETVREQGRQQNQKHRERRKEYGRQWREAHPERARAHDAVNKALRSGRLVRPDRCEDCETVGRVEGHHPDYAKRLEVRWLCKPCHAQADRERDGVST